MISTTLQIDCSWREVLPPISFQLANRWQGTLSSFEESGIRKTRKFEFYEVNPSPLFEVLNFPVTRGSARNFYEVSLSATRGEVCRRTKAGEPRRNRECLWTRRRHYCPPFKNRIVQNRRNTFPASYSSRAAGATALALFVDREEGLSNRVER